MSLQLNQQTKFGDSTTSDCERIMKRKKAKPQRPGVIQHASQFCSHVPSLIASESHQAWSEQERNVSPAVPKQESPFRVLFLMLKNGWSPSFSWAQNYKKRQLNCKSSPFSSLTQSLHCLSVFPSHLPALLLLLIIADTPEGAAESLRKTHQPPVICMVRIL